MRRARPWFQTIAGLCLIVRVGLAQDLNGNAVRDSIDIRNGTSGDCNHNGIPDEVEFSRPDFSAAIEHFSDGATLSNVSGVALLDADLDGDLDLMAASRSGQNDSNLTLWRNDGGPRLVFAMRTTVTNALCSTVRTADLDGDSRADVISADSGFAQVIVMRGTGPGTFAAPTRLTSGSRGTGAAVGDADGDGDIDIAMAGFGSNAVDVFLNQGNATFAARQSYPCGQQPGSVSLADFTGDGLADLAVGNTFISAPGAGTVSLLRNTGAGAFAPHATLVVPGHAETSMNSAPHDVALVDIDLDGDADLLVSSKVSNSLQIFGNDGGGAFAVIQTLGPLPVIGGSADRFVCQNLDQDAAPEIAWCDSNARAIRVFDNAGGTFAISGSSAVGGMGPVALAAGDLTGDGVAELCAAGDSSGAFSVLTGMGQLVFDAAHHIQRDDISYYPILADFTGDGLTDLASYATFDAPTTFRISPGLGGGRFGPAMMESLPSAAPLLTRDLNSDGHLDILGLGNSGQRYAKLNQGDGTFGPAVFSDAVDIHGNYQTADINGDGWLDFLWSWGTTSNAPHFVRISLGDGTGFFAPYYEVETPRFLGSVWTGDLSGDGRPELFVGLGGGALGDPQRETFLVYPNLGDGTFGAYTIHAHELMPGFLGGVGNFAWADMDGDGDSDLLASSTYTWLFRNTGGELAEPEQLGGLANYGQTMFGPAVLDADEDGDVDLIGTAAINGISSPAIYFNDGAGRFGPRAGLMRFRNSTEAMAVGDADNNGRPDVLVKPQGFSDLYLHLNHPSQAEDCNANGTPDSCDIGSGESADANGDGVPDECGSPGCVAGDVDCDGNVDLADLSRLLSAFGTCGGDAEFDDGADFDGSGCIGISDLAVLLANFGS